MAAELGICALVPRVDSVSKTYYAMIAIAPSARGVGETVADLTLFRHWPEIIKDYTWKIVTDAGEIDATVVDDLYPSGSGTPSANELWAALFEDSLPLEEPRGATPEAARATFSAGAVQYEIDQYNRGTLERAVQRSSHSKLGDPPPGLTKLREFADALNNLLSGTPDAGGNRVQKPGDEPKELDPFVRTFSSTAATISRYRELAYRTKLLLCLKLASPPTAGITMARAQAQGADSRLSFPFTSTTAAWELSETASTRPSGRVHLYDSLHDGLHVYRAYENQSNYAFRFTSSGIFVSDDEFEGLVNRMLTIMALKNRDDRPYNLEQLIRGYTISVTKIDPERRKMGLGSRRSLCARSNLVLSYGENKKLSLKDDVSWVAPSTISKDKAATDPLVHPGLFRWDGYSLVFAPPWESVEVSHEYRVNDAVSITGSPKGLASLRFGQTYRIDATAVLLDGAPLQGYSYQLDDQTYYRTAQIAPPVLGFINAPPKDWPDTVTQIVLRSYDVGQAEGGDRYLYPARVSADLLIQHGKMDLNQAKDGWECPNKEAYDRYLILNDPIPQASDGTDKHYLSDPLGRHVTIQRVDKQDQTLTVDFHGDWPETTPLQIQLVDSPNPDNASSTIWLDSENSNVVNVYLEPAETAIFCAFVQPDADALSLFAPVAQYLAVHPKGLIDLGKALEGQSVSTINPPMTFEATRAVQTPLAKPDITQIKATDRAAGQTLQEFYCDGRMPISSSDRIELHAWWDEKISAMPNELEAIVHHQSVLGVLPLDDSSSTDPATRKLVYDFRTTKAYNVTVKYKVLNRFRQYYDKPNSLETNEYCLKLKATTKPKVAPLMFALPAMQTSNHQDNRLITYRRDGSRLRLFFSSWYDSGDGEQVFITFPAGGGVFPNPAYDGKADDRFVCDGVPQPVKMKDASGTTVTVLGWLYEPVPPTVPGDPYYVDVAIRQVDGSEPKALLPFVKLLVGRYQPQAIDNVSDEPSGAHLSTPLVTTEFVQVLPDRSVSITYGPTPDRRVSVNLPLTAQDPVPLKFELLKFNPDALNWEDTGAKLTVNNNVCEFTIPSDVHKPYLFITETERAAGSDDPRPPDSYGRVLYQVGIDLNATITGEPRPGLPYLVRTGGYLTGVAEAEGRRANQYHTTKSTPSQVEEVPITWS